MITLKMATTMQEVFQLYPTKVFFRTWFVLIKREKDTPKHQVLTKLLGAVVMLNFFKHKRNKAYHLTATIKPKYPPHLAEEDTQRMDSETTDDHKGYFRDNLFNCPDIHKKNRVRCSDITTSLNALRGVTGVRAFFKVNKSKIPPELRAGNKVKGF